MDKICIYLRKSRADEELEKTLGEGETLLKHRKALLKFAKEKKLNIVEIKEEIVSGESLFFRPKMLELLKEVEAKMYTGVLVMDMQRLGRGDMKDQGIVLETFKNSHTKIITPMKTYDLDNDFDEEYSEFEAFMSRKELKMINRRMQGGRVRSIEDGNYISANPPFGYDITFINKNRTLKPNPKEAEIVKLIFKLYTDGNGAGIIANRLNALGYSTKNCREFESSSILFILKNPVYIGKVTWRKKEIKKSKNPNKVKDTRTRNKSEWIVADGKHKPIISDEIFNQAKEILKNKYHVPYQLKNGAVNPLAGIITCGVCGSKMVLRKYGNRLPHIICMKKCGNKSARFDYVEKALLNALETLLNNYESNMEKINKNNSKIDTYKIQISVLEKKLSTLNSQKMKLFDLLEQGIYDNNTFVERSNNLADRSNKVSTEMNSLKELLKKEDKSKNLNLSKIRDAIKEYKSSKDITEKNQLLKSILIEAKYIKSKNQRNDDFDLQLYTRF
ncbi:recombinase family protein [Clostridium felsineum]|uniref:Uncharacterized protein n=1 Tax=Clostridium felsineum TaxID=36839 RepID=A0A1S8L077_9CLOT|nr:recombinase family protein [Clostridium felsineum]URZ06418.1 hypothetical protein CLROS_017510 [Clostridium felsineum]URZ11453.1 hypothetical protein CROST_021700 [Clostridium felsineum]